MPTAGVPSEILDESPVQSTRLPDAEVEPRTSGDQTSYSKTQNEEQLWRNTKHLEHFETWAREETERLLGEVNGHLGSSDRQTVLISLNFSKSIIQLSFSKLKTMQTTSCSMLTGFSHS